MALSRTAVAAGYASLMGRFALPLFVNQTWASRTHPETVVKAHRYTLATFNDRLHGRHWKRRGIDGCQSILGVERQRNFNPHSHAVVGHPTLNLSAPEFDDLRVRMQAWAEGEWGFAKFLVAKSPESVNAYVSKYICKDGEIFFSDRLEVLNAQASFA